MTLVVAHRTPFRLRLMADMRVTVREAIRQPSYTSGALKLVTVPPDCCIGFAGEPVEIAYDVLREIQRDSGLNTGDVLERLLDAHSCGAADSIQRPTTGEVARPPRAAWHRGGIAALARRGGRRPGE